MWKTGSCVDRVTYESGNAVVREARRRTLVRRCYRYLPQYQYDDVTGTGMHLPCSVASIQPQTGERPTMTHLLVVARVRHPSLCHTWMPYSLCVSEWLP